MGADHSKEVPKEDFQRLYRQYYKERNELTEQLRVITASLRSDEELNIPNAPITCTISFVKRADGSSVKELWIPAWGVAFYDGDHGLEIREDASRAVLNGMLVTISAEHAILLRNALIKHRAARGAAVAADVVLQKYLKEADSTKT